MPTSNLYTRITACRSCGSTALEDILDLGITPLADRLMTKARLKEEEPVCPLTLAFCPDCSLVQIRETVRPEILFGEDYPYYSSVSPALLEHFGGSVKEILGRRKLASDSLALELASNDGYLLRNYVAAGIPVLGIDPASGPAKRAMENGVNTRIDFFTLELARQLEAEGIAADVIHGNNVLAHVADTNGFIEGIALLLKQDGEAVIECPYLGDLIEHCEFDTIYHQHLCYFSVKALQHLLARHGLFLNRVLRTPIHGGSLRLFIGKQDEPDESVKHILASEEAAGMHQSAYYKQFADRVNALGKSLNELLDDLLRQGKTIAGYGAAAKACTMMSHFGIGKDQLQVVVDRNEFKHGRMMPGNHLPIEPVSWIVEHKPDYLLLLSWNFAEEIIKQQHEYRYNGGKFILPVPELKVI